MKKLLLIALGMSGVLLMNAGCASLSRPSDDVVVTIDDKKITHGEIMQGVQMNLEQISQMLPQQRPPKKLIYKNVTDTLVANILLTKAAEKLNLTVSDEDLAKEIATIAAAAPEGTSLKDALAENKIDYAEWKIDLRKQMMVRKLVEEKTAVDATEQIQDLMTKTKKQKLLLAYIEDLKKQSVIKYY